MQRFLIIETRDPVEHRDVERIAALAAGIEQEGCNAALFLTENAVIAARPGVAPFLETLAAQGVPIGVDRVALAERGMSSKDMAPGMTVSGIETVVDALLAGARAIWR